MSESQPHPSGELDGEDEDAARAEPAGLADERFAVNVRETRERLKLSQGELARRMAERGFPFYQQTIRRIEEGRRKVSVGEGKALGQILGTPMERLTWPGREASAAALLDMVSANAHQAHDEIFKWTGTLLWALAQLGTTIREAERDDYLGSAKIRDLVADARETLGLTPEGAVAQARQDHQELYRKADDERS
jgi:transcriptional regulator with XRE-family HTH domain